MPQFTITKIVHTDARQFGFCICNETGEQHYIPALVIRRLQMTAADEGSVIRSAVRSWSYALKDPVLVFPSSFEPDLLASLTDSRDADVQGLLESIRKLLAKQKSRVR